ncbi:MAG: hypothetical protein ACRYHB_13770 [Janthinobacterium lividum]
MQILADSRFQGEELVPPRSTALLYGYDERLMLTRQFLVRRVGCSSETAIDAGEYQAQIATKHPGVIVFCQTLTSEECSEASHYAADHCPESRLLVMFHSAQKCAPEQEHLLLDSSTGPISFSRAVLGLVA